MLKELIRKVRWLDVNQDGASGWRFGCSLFVAGKLADEPWIDGLIFGSDVGSDVGPVDAEPLFGEIWSSGYGDVKVVRLELSGLIMRGAEEKWFGVAADPVETLLRQIRCATEG